MQLVKPSVTYKDSFIEAAMEYQNTDERNSRNRHYKSLNIRELEQSFEAHLQTYTSKKSQPKGRVPETTFWLVDQDKFIGRVSIRHILNEKLHKDGGHIGYDIRPSRRRQGYGKRILELGLRKAKELGIENALITCDVGNTPSKKIIEANGGTLENSVATGHGSPDKLRYWVKIK